MSAAAGAAGSEISMQEMLKLAKELATDGTAKGTIRALELVTDLIRETRGGEGAVLEALRAAKENKQRVMAADERPGLGWVLLKPVGTEEELKAPESLLGEFGRDKVIMDAAEDGSSCMCTKCGALVAYDRLEQHVNFWCDALSDKEDDDDT